MSRYRVKRNGLMHVTHRPHRWLPPITKHGRMERLLAGPVTEQRYYWMWRWRLARESFRYRQQPVYRLWFLDWFQVQIANPRFGSHLVEERATGSTTVIGYIDRDGLRRWWCTPHHQLNSINPRRTLHTSLRSAALAAYVSWYLSRPSDDPIRKKEVT